jgi:membrane-bound lytic murein transglycosylase B
MNKLLLAVLMASTLSAKYTNCEFQNNHYIDICKKVVKNGVSHDYANKFLLSYFKTQKYDEISWKYLQPRHIKTHKKSEKKANNVLVKYVPKIVTHLKKYKAVYDYSEKKYGVNREIIAAILMKETKLGKIKPTHDAFIVFNTIVVRTKAETSRQKWLLKMGKTNMVSIITHCYEKGVKPESCNLPSSYAGAIGIPQFMPNSFVYTDGYKTTLIEWDKMPDIPKVESAWYDFEHKYENASLVYSENRHGKKYKCYTCEKEELDYLKEYAKKVMRYNNSSNYAIGVIRLAYDSHYLLNK